MVVNKKSPQLVPPERNDRKRYIVLLMLLIGSAALLFYSKDITKLSPERRQKLEKELEELENAEQYALVAAKDEWYSCFNCPGEVKIFLHRGEVWKYGVTKKGERGRYGNWHVNQGLTYFVQFQGSYQECLKQEKIKIYTYAQLPENLRRQYPLIRPPGNKRDT